MRMSTCPYLLVNGYFWGVTGIRSEMPLTEKASSGSLITSNKTSHKTTRFSAVPELPIKLYFSFSSPLCKQIT